jgi:hypothetical protein
MIGRVREERGAVLVIVTLLLLALMGMLVLVVDVGGLFYRRVQLQNAADAAALAAAISCGKAEGVLEARAQADLYTLENSDSAFVAPGYPQFFPSCTAPSGRVTVLVRAQQQLFFAPAIGGGGSGQVQAQATAIWGGAGAGEHVAPLMLSAHRLTTCEIPPPPGSPIPEGGIICAFWWNNSPRADIEDLTNAEWGTLDLLKWDVTADTHCDNSTPPQFEEWMFQGFFEPLPINPGEHPLAPHTDPHTYVCRGQGNFGASLDNIIDDAIFDPAVDEEPLFLYFPVNDPFGQIDADGLPCVPLELLADPLDFRPCSVDKYDIIGFARLEIIALYKGNTPEAEAACPDLWVRDANARCMVARWVEYTTEGLEPDGGENFGLVPVKLID